MTNNKFRRPPSLTGHAIWFTTTSGKRLFSLPGLRACRTADPQLCFRQSAAAIATPSAGRQCFAPAAAPNADPPRQARCAPAQLVAADCGRPGSPPIARARQAHSHTYLLSHAPFPGPAPVLHVLMGLWILSMVHSTSRKTAPKMHLCQLPDGGGRGGASAFGQTLSLMPP